LPLTGHLGTAPVDFQILIAVIADFYPDRAVAIFRFHVFFPQIGRLKDVAVGVNYEGFSRHRH
jgi:hypothetical protein